MAEPVGDVHGPIGRLARRPIEEGVEAGRSHGTALGTDPIPRRARTAVGRSPRHPSAGGEDQPEGEAGGIDRRRVEGIAQIPAFEGGGDPEFDRGRAGRTGFGSRGSFHPLPLRRRTESTGPHSGRATASVVTALAMGMGGMSLPLLRFRRAFRQLDPDLLGALEGPCERSPERIGGSSLSPFGVPERLANLGRGIGFGRGTARGTPPKDRRSAPEERRPPDPPHARSFPRSSGLPPGRGSIDLDSPMGPPGQGRRRTRVPPPVLRHSASSRIQSSETDRERIQISARAPRNRYPEACRYPTIRLSRARSGS